MSNIVEIVVKGTDKSGPAIDSAAKGQIKLNSALKDGKPAALGVAGAADKVTASGGRLRAAQLQVVAAQERYNKLATQGKASQGQLAAAEAAVIRAKQGVTDATKKETGAVDKAKGALGAYKLIVAGGAVLAAKSFVSAASDLNETQNKSNVIFGKGSAEVTKWAQNSAKAFGLSRNEALDAAASFGDMFRQIGFAGNASAQMSEQVVKMAADLGSFNNLPTGEVLDMIAGGFRGEYDALQRVIPNISAARVQQEALNETHKKSATDLTAAEKAQATLNIIMKDGSRAVGDFSRTSGGLANKTKILSAQWKDAQASLGAILIPAVKTGVGALSTMAGFMERNKRVVIPLIGVLGGLAATVWTVNKATAAWKATQTAMNTLMGVEAGGAGKAAVLLGKLAIAAGVGIGTYKGLNAVFNDSAESFARGSSATQNLVEAFTRSKGVIDDNVKSAQRLNLEQSGIAKRAAESGITMDQLTAALTGPKAGFEDLITTWKKLGDPSAQTLDAFRELRLQMNLAQGNTKQAATELDNLGNKSVSSAEELKSLATQMNVAKKAANDQAAQLDILNGSLDKLSNNAIDAKQQELRLRDDLAAVTDQVKANGRSLDENTAKGRSNIEWVLDRISAINSHVSAVGKETGSVQKATQALGADEAALRAAARAAGFNTQQVDALIRKYAATPKQVSTNINASTQAARDKIAALQYQIDRLHGKVLSIDIYQTTHQAGPAAGGHLAQASGGVWRGRHYASGGAAGGTGMINDGGGPEIVRLPDGSMVYPAGQSAGMAAQWNKPQQPVVLEIRSGGSRLDDLLVELMRRAVRVRGGDVQLVLGKNG